MKSVLYRLIATVALCAPLLTGCEQTPAIGILSDSSPVGGVVGFSGIPIGDVIQEAQNYCKSLNAEQSAIPIGFYKAPDGTDRDYLMTFECKKNSAAD